MPCCTSNAAGPAAMKPQHLLGPARNTVVGAEQASGELRASGGVARLLGGVEGSICQKGGPAGILKGGGPSLTGKKGVALASVWCVSGA